MHATKLALPPVGALDEAAAEVAADVAADVAGAGELVIGKDGALAINFDDELVKGTLVAKDGALVHPLLQGTK